MDTYKSIAKIVLIGGGESGLPHECEQVIVLGENDYFVKAKIGNNNQYFGLLMNRDHIGEDEYDVITNAVHSMLNGKVGEVRDGYHSFDELYDFRKAYNACLFNVWATLPDNPYDVHKSYKHSDGEDCFGGGWFVVQATTPFGQISNHYKNVDWTLFNVPVKENANEWDGHTSKDALERLFNTAAKSLIIGG